MSDRGSFVTEFIYCTACFQAVKTILLSQEKRLWSMSIPLTDGREYPIVAGKVGSTYSEGELDFFEHELVPALEKLVCHTIRIAVLAEVGERFFLVEPHVKKAS